MSALSEYIRDVRRTFDTGEAREHAYRNSGWNGYDPNAPVYDADQIRRERDAYRL